jgi:hypothetical protein
MDDAISHGIKSTAGVVTSAAIVMVAVNATLVRVVLLPATMKLLGDGPGTSRVGWSGCHGWSPGRWFRPQTVGELLGSRAADPDS